MSKLKLIIKRFTELCVRYTSNSIDGKSNSDADKKRLEIYKGVIERESGKSKSDR